MSTATYADDDAIQRALVYAALSGPFDPKQALKEISAQGDLRRMLTAANRLSNVCDTRPADVEGLWLMRTPARHSLLKGLSEQDRDNAVAARREAGAVDEQTLDILGLLQDRAPLDSKQVQAIIEGQGDKGKLERLIVALDRVGPLAPAGLLQRARFALANVSRAAKFHRISQRDFFGREEELQKIEKWLSNRGSSGPATCLYLSGAPGVGKSSLLAEAVGRYYSSHNPVILRLDFDRAGLDVLDQTGLTMEATRQIAEQLGNQGLVEERLRAGRADGQSKDRSTLRQRFPERLGKYLGNAVSSSGRPVLVILDTLEVLRGRGESHPGALFRWLDSLKESGVRPMHVLGAGRGNALDVLRNIPPRLIDRSSSADPARYQEVVVTGLHWEAATGLLTRLGVPVRMHDQLYSMSEGNPLRLRLAAAIANQVGGWEQLAGKKGQNEFSGAFLYRLLLSRIEDPELARLAHPGLIVRRISAELIMDVLAPTLGLKNVDLPKARDLLQRLASHHWLVEEDVGAPGFLKHRSDMRTLLLPMLYASAPKQSARIDTRAVRWFAALPADWAQVEAVYHQLQLTRAGGPIPSLALNIASQIDAEMLAELPRKAADLVLSTRGDRSSLFREARPYGAAQLDSDVVIREVLTLLERRDWLEGAQFAKNILGDGGLDPRSLAADAIRALLWRCGQWARARDLLAERDLFADSDQDLEKLPPPIALARLEMRAELDPEGLRRTLRTGRLPLTWVDRASLAAKDEIARQGSLAYILNESNADHFSSDPLELGDVVSTTRNFWTGPERDSDLVERVRQRAIERMRQAGLPVGYDVPFGRAVAVLTPYNSVLEVLALASSSRPGLSKLAGSASLSASRRWGQMFREPWHSLDRSFTGEGIQLLTDLGVVAEWAEMVAFVRSDDNWRLVSRCAERWRRTVAGDWAFGRRRGDWRRRALLDETTYGRLRSFMLEPTNVDHALEQVHAWQDALDGPPLVDLLASRFAKTLHEVRMESPTNRPLESVTRQLLVRGVPVVIAPAIAVLATHRAI